jgi:peptidoglycan/xylan/chitin deacetylase (PgdA/CDA1 family)
LLNKSYKVKWVADYRDDWNSSQWKKFYNWFQLFFEKAETFFERKWIKSSEIVTSVSDYYVDIISTFVNKKGASIMNGYDEADYTNQHHDYYPEFTIVYNGTLYNSQPIEIFLEGLKKTIDLYKKSVSIRILFPGLSVDSRRADEIKDSLRGYENNYVITGRVKKEKVIEIQQKSHILLMVGHTGIKGTTSSKIFEYLACRKTIILCPTDEDILENIINETKSGFICNTSSDIEAILKRKIDEFIKTGTIDYKSDTSEIEKYSRKNQTKKLAEVFDTINTSESNQRIKYKTSLRDLIFKGLYSFGINKLLHQINNKEVIILCFHNISNDVSYSYPHLSVEVFEKIIIYLKNNFNIIKLDEISKIRNNSRTSIIVTFDDGYKDFISNALPVLKKYNIPSINNIIVGYIESKDVFWSAKLNLILDAVYRRCINFSFTYKNITFDYIVEKDASFEKISIALLRELYKIDKVERDIFLLRFAEKVNILINSENMLMDWTDLKYCVEHGVAIGSHTLTHDSLTSSFNNEQIIEEILDSKSILEEKLGIEISTIAFPNGLYNESVFKIANHHYKYILSTEETGLKRKDIYNLNKNSILPRISLNKKTFEENILKLNNFHNLVKFNF